MANLSAFVNHPDGLLSLRARAVTLSANLDLSTAANQFQYEPVLFVDPTAARDLTLEPEALAVNLTRYIGNVADGAEDITVKNDAGDTIGTVPRQRMAVFNCDGTAWTMAANFIVLSAT